MQITLTHQAPVKIDPDRWPLIAEGEDCDDRAHPFQANRQWWIKVRQHADGRSIVYGAHTSNFQGESDTWGGMVVDPDEDLSAAIRDLADELGADQIVSSEAISNLPVVELT